MKDINALGVPPTASCGRLMPVNPLTGRLSQIMRLACLSLCCISTLAVAQAGHLDTTFGNGAPGFFGFSQSSTNGSTSLANAVALQIDGKIVIAGQAGNRSALLRLTTNGNLDSSFGTGGVVTSRIGGDINQLFTSMAIQSDGKILVTASGCPPRDELARFNTDGSLDTAFGTSGIATLSIRALGVTVQPDGKILVTGENYPMALMARLLSNGQPDTTFGSNGQAALIASATSVALQSDGKILIGSSGVSSGSLARYNSNGSLDKSFGILGQAGSVPPIVAIAVQTDGRILAAGTNVSRLSVNGNSSGFGLIRFNSNGTLDATFGTRGGVTTAFANAPNTSAAAVKLQTNGQIVAAGSAGSSSGSAFALARYAGTGSLDPTFGTAGLVTSGFNNQVATISSMALQGDGKIVVAGTVAGSVIEVARYLGQ